MRKAGQMGTVRSRPRTKISQTATLKKTQSKRVRIQRKGRLPKEDKKTITAVAGMRPAGLSSTAKIVTDPRITKKLYQSNFPNLPPSSSELLKRTDFAVIKKPRKKKTAEQHREIARTHAEGRPDVVVVNRVEAEKTSEGHEHQTGPKISLILDHR